MQPYNSSRRITPIAIAFLLAVKVAPVSAASPLGPRGADIPVNKTTGLPLCPAVAMNARGVTLVTWQSDRNAAANQIDVAGRRDPRDPRRDPWSGRFDPRVVRFADRVGRFDPKVVASASSSRRRGDRVAASD